MDGAVLPKAVSSDRAKTIWLDTINAGKFKKVPLIVGNTQYEYKDLMTLNGWALKYFFQVPSGKHNWINLYDVLNGTKTLKEVLPTKNDVYTYEKTGLLKSRKWQAECNAIARAIKTNDPTNRIYSYLFTWSGGKDPDLDSFKFIFGAAHAQDIPFFFGDSTDFFKGYSFTAANKAGRVALQEAMMDYLASYVKTSAPNPSGSSLPTWLQWSNTAGDPKFIKFDADLTNRMIGMDTAEATKEIVTREIQVVVNTNKTFFHDLFSFPGVEILPY
jgi:carboxylesterase type B